MLARRMIQGVAAAALVLGAFAVVTAQTVPGGDVILEGWAVLPADTFAEGPITGTLIDPTGNNNGRTVPFASHPVQGVSALIPASDTTWYALSDNGFGAKSNSGDYLLRFYEVSVDWDAQSVDVLGFVQLSDPDRLVDFPIVNNDTEDRLLTGQDFDIESLRMLEDGTFWLGEEFGPYLLHIDATGKLLAAPIPTPYPTELAEFSRGLDFIQSSDNPAFVDLADADARAAAANQGSSRGFEGMALNTSGTLLYPLLEGALLDDTVRTRLLIQEFDPATAAYTGNYWYYPLSNPAHAIGEMTAINDTQFIVIERDNNQGYAAGFKRIYLVDTAVVGDDGHTLTKTLVADLMAIVDANGLTTQGEGTHGFGAIFQFPFVTIESVYPVDADTLLIVNDNNYPFSSGRRPGTNADDTEFILITLPTPLDLVQ